MANAQRISSYRVIRLAAVATPRWELYTGFWGRRKTLSWRRRGAYPACRSRRSSIAAATHPQPQQPVWSRAGAVFVSRPCLLSTPGCGRPSGHSTVQRAYNATPHREPNPPFQVEVSISMSGFKSQSRRPAVGKGPPEFPGRPAYQGAKPCGCQSLRPPGTDRGPREAELGLTPAHCCSRAHTGRHLHHALQTDRRPKERLFKWWPVAAPQPLTPDPRPCHVSSVPQALAAVTPWARGP